MNKTAQEQVINKINTALELFENPWNDLGGKKVLTDLKKDVEEIFASQFQNSPKWVRVSEKFPEEIENCIVRNRITKILISEIEELEDEYLISNGEMIEYWKLEWLDETGNVFPQAENILGIEFAEFVGSGFWFNNGDSDLWESFHEGEEFEVNGQMQFRFTTQELYQVFLTKNNEQ